jgi:hypothetical protein
MPEPETASSQTPSGKRQAYLLARCDTPISILVTPDQTAVAQVRCGFRREEGRRMLHLAGGFELSLLRRKPVGSGMARGWLLRTVRKGDHHPRHS